MNRLKSTHIDVHALIDFDVQNLNFNPVTANGRGDLFPASLPSSLPHASSFPLRERKV